MSRKKRWIDVMLTAHEPDDLRRVIAEAREEVAEYRQFHVDLTKVGGGEQLFEDHFRKDYDDARVSVIIGDARLQRMTA